MEDRYSKFKKLNWLLSESFEAERIFYNAGEDVQQVELKRFFNRETVIRNRFSYEISEKLVQAGVEPVKGWAQKGHLERDWRAERKALIKPKPLKLLRKCREKDVENLQLYNQIIEENYLSKEIIKMLKKHKKLIKAAVAQIIKFESGEHALNPRHTPRVIKLKAI